MDSQGEQRDSKNVDWGKGYAWSGKIMMSVFVILFFVVILMLGLHLYARWYLLRVRRRQRARARSRPRRTHLVFHVDPSNPNAAHVTLPSRGLDADVLKSLPVFVYSSDTHPDPIECAVCLSELEDKEIGRTLPKCNHSFHIQCIDMWFHSHSTCPLCRSPVESVPENPAHVVPSTDTTETSACSDLCDTCRHEAEQMGPSTTSFRGRSKPAGLVGVTIDIPGTNFDSESRAESPATQSLRSPMYRVLSFTRILSRERRGSVSPPSSSAATCGGGPAAAESDIERGKEETQETR